MSIGKQITVWRVRPNDMQAIAPGEVLNTGYDLILKSEHDAALRRAKAEGEDELLKLRIYTQTLQRALRNCHMLARRIVVSESAFFKIDSANHIIRMCEEAGIIQDGVLRDDARAAQIEEGE